MHISRVIQMIFHHFLRHLLVKYTKRPKIFVFVYIHPILCIFHLFDVCAAQINLIEARGENIFFELERIYQSVYMLSKFPLPQHLHYFPLFHCLVLTLFYFWIFSQFKTSTQKLYITDLCLPMKLLIQIMCFFLYRLLN